MRTTTFLRITALVTFIIGLTLIIFPLFTANLFTPDSVTGSEIFIQFLGSSLIGFAFLNWYTAKLNTASVTRPALLGNFSTLLTATVLSTIGILNGSLKMSGILIVLLHTLFASGFGWFLLNAPVKKSKS